MEALVVAVQKGGPFMWLVLLAGMFGLTVAVAAAVMSALGARVPTVAWWAAPVFMVLIGALGTIQGLLLTAEAVSHASEEVRVTLAHARDSTALFTLLAGCVLAGQLLAVSSWLGVIGQVKEPGPSAAEAAVALAAGLAAGLAGVAPAARDLGGRGQLSAGLGALLVLGGSLLLVWRVSLSLPLLVASALEVSQPRCRRTRRGPRRSP